MKKYWIAILMDCFIDRWKKCGGNAKNSNFWQENCWKKYTKNQNELFSENKWTEMKLKVTMIHKKKSMPNESENGKNLKFIKVKWTFKKSFQWKCINNLNVKIWTSKPKKRVNGSVSIKFYIKN